MNFARQTKWWVLFLWWTVVGGLCVLSVVGRGDYTDLRCRHEGTQVAAKPFPQAVKNFHFLYWDAEKNYLPRAEVSIGQLIAENGSLGFFRTALHKTVKMDDLGLKFFSYAADDSGKETTYGSRLERIWGDVHKRTTGQVAIKDVVRKALHNEGGTIRTVDVSNTTRIVANDFECQFFCDGVLTLAMNCRRAQINHDEPDMMILRGHATVRLADGEKLESNVIRWDLRRDRFDVEGSYVLNDQDGCRHGRGIQLVAPPRAFRLEKL